MWAAPFFVYLSLNCKILKIIVLLFCSVNPMWLTLHQHLKQTIWILST